MPFSEIVNQSARFAEHTRQDAHRLANNKFEILAEDTCDEVVPSIEDAGGGTPQDIHRDTSDDKLIVEHKVEQDPALPSSPSKTKGKRSRKANKRMKKKSSES